ncbi:MAG: hypothetical protein WC399_00470 [Bacilli bacterium]|jgi:hypothetical protein
MRYNPEPIDAETLEYERQKRSQRRINVLLLVLDIALLGLVIYELTARLIAL